MCPGIAFLGFILFGVFSAFWIMWCMLFAKFGRFLGFFQIFFQPHAFSPLRDSSNVNDNSHILVP